MQPADLPPWQSTTFEGRDGTRLRVEALPGVHAHSPLARLLPRVMGSLLEFDSPAGERLRLYLTGDTLVGDHVTEIARRTLTSTRPCCTSAAPGSSARSSR